MSACGFRYRSLSSIASSMLPTAERMHRQGVSWREISRELGVSYTTLFNWRRIKEDPSRGARAE